MTKMGSRIEIPWHHHEWLEVMHDSTTGLYSVICPKGHYDEERFHTFDGAWAHMIELQRGMRERAIEERNRRERAYDLDRARWQGAAIATVIIALLVFLTGVFFR